MSHELHALNGVIGFTRLTLKTDLNHAARPPDHHRTFGQQSAGDHQRRARLFQAGSREADPGEYSVPAAHSLDEVVTLLAHSAHDKGLELTLNIKNNVPDNVIGDRCVCSRCDQPGGQCHQIHRARQYRRSGGAAGHQ
jgi:two-component system sensor histidine kinase BarA